MREETSYGTRKLLKVDPKDKALQSVSAHRKDRINKYALGGAILASTNSVLLGYDIGVMSGAVLYIKDNLKISSTQVEILVGCLNVCSLASGRTSDYIGRRYTIILAAVTFLIGAFLMGLAPCTIFHISNGWKDSGWHWRWLFTNDCSSLYCRALPRHDSRLPILPS